MPFISVSDGVAAKSFTHVENKFITKYMPELDPLAVKVYLFALYVYQCGQSYTLLDLSKALNISEEDAEGYFKYLEEFELVSITSETPFEIKILDAENVYGTPKKLNPEKYADFAKSVQNILKGRMISPSEFRDYFYLIEEYGFEQNALLMIINYCVNLKGDDIRAAYIKKVAKTFAQDGITTAAKVDEKLSSYTSSTPALVKLFAAAGFKGKPDVDDDKLYKKWVTELGFEDEGIAAAAKLYKAKNTAKLDEALEELFKNRKFDKKEIEDFCATKSSVYSLALDVAKSLGVYMQNSSPYVENYVSVWLNCGFTFDGIKKISAYCFKNGMNSFQDMDAFIKKLYDGGMVSDDSIAEYISEREKEDKILREILSACGLTRKIIPWDRESLARWRSWNFSDGMLFEAAKISSGKSNPLAYMNGVLSSWKSEGIMSEDKIDRKQDAPNAGGSREERAALERHYFSLRQAAELRAERILKTATADPEYGAISKKLNELSIKLAFAEIRDKNTAATLSSEIAELEKRADRRLKELNIDKADFTPKYSCGICNDTGYDKDGKPCKCMIEFLKTL